MNIGIDTIYFDKPIIQALLPIYHGGGGDGVEEADEHLGGDSGDISPPNLLRNSLFRVFKS
jgi:hypothetical protein